MSRKPILGVVGTGDDSDTKACELARELGRLIAVSRQAILLCGARGGVMRAAAEGARDANAAVGRIGIHPGRSGADAAIDCAIYTGLGDGRNYVNACASDLLIACHGGPGTLSEIALALKLRRPVVLLPPWHFLGPFLQQTEAPRIAFVQGPAEALDQAFRLLAQDLAQLPGHYPAWPGQERQKAQFDEYVRRKFAE